MGIGRMASTATEAKEFQVMEAIAVTDGRPEQPCKGDLRMSDEQEPMAKSLVRKLLAREKLTKAERDLLGSSDSIMSAVLRELSSANGPPNGASLSVPEGEAAMRALAHGKAMMAREFPGVFGDAG